VDVMLPADLGDVVSLLVFDTFQLFVLPLIYTD